MKLLAAYLLAIALVFRAAPLCASPVTTDVIAAIPDCGGAGGHHDEERGQKGEDAARACHACVAPPVASTLSDHPMLPAAAPVIEAVTRFAGAMAEPPTPPPRLGGANIFEHFNGVKS